MRAAKLSTVREIRTVACNRRLEFPVNRRLKVFIKKKKRRRRKKKSNKQKERKKEKGGGRVKGDALKRLDENLDRETKMEWRNGMKRMILEIMK